MSVDVVPDGNLAHSRSYVVTALELFARYGERTAIVAGDHRLSYAGLRTQVLDLAATLQERGVGAGTGVLVLAGNTAELPALQLALHLVGARTMWIAPIAGRREIEAFARLSQPDVFVYDATSKAVLGERLAVQLGVPVHCLGPGGLGPDLLRPRPDGATRFEPEHDDVEPATCLQTSGTTGEPKLVHHRQAFYEQILTLAADYLAAGLPVLRHLSHSPMAFASGQITSFFNLFLGGVLFLENEWDAGRALATIERERINSTYVSPPLLYQLLDHPDLATTDVSSLFMLNVGAGPAAPSRLRQAIARFGPVLRIVYGLSEVIVVTAQPGLTEDPEHPERLRSSGTPYGDVRVEIRDADGHRLPPGQTGEIYATSKLRFAGYWGRPDLTERAIVEGWVRTGDLGYLDADGYLYVVDRVQDTIVTGASNWNVYCRPIEDLLQAQPGIRAAAVIGVPDDEFGEVPHAYVARYPDAAVTAEALQEAVRDEYNAMWVPRRIEFVDALPLTSAHKVDKVALRSAAAGAARGPV
ncbi:AMP-dependent synthetase and ligase [Kribbella flavida DSM 17836]|uniref:AMP-dependent synthetase and ligase n=1 Tax=Kribbella flavida (strain DSM 17836 / JCM 10339 / NBRC 14399) TaxID=479435 RepID=D2PT06_KRIFD|nr:AMP-binding protein [Kribbella flavida]ADB35058.1 AMP-dependent synthetase and ligase [Kribbella flavida DSM 17836]